MEFRIPLEEYSDDDEVLSFCDLVTEQGVQDIALRDSNTGSLDHEGFGFEFDFCRSDSTTENIFLADDIFRHGRLLPLQPQRSRTESLQFSSFEKSKSENLLTRRNDSFNSESSLMSTSSRKSGEILRLCNSKSKGKHNYKPTTFGGKISAKDRVFTLGLMKPPLMKLEDIRLRQGKNSRNINGAKNLDLSRSVSCNYYKAPKIEEKEAKAVNFQDKCWKTLARLPSFKSCKTSSIAVVENYRLQKACKKAERLR